MREYGYTFEMEDRLRTTEGAYAATDNEADLEQWSRYGAICGRDEFCGSGLLSEAMHDQLSAREPPASCRMIVACYRTMATGEIEAGF